MFKFQIILVACVVILLLRFLGNPTSSKTQAWKKLLGVGFSLLALIIILLPELANKAAHLLGIGRGADLLLYLLTIAFIFSSISAYITSKKQQADIVKITRKLAIEQATQRHIKQ